MAVLSPRNRLIYFRVSEEEFRRFSELCLSEGARSLSEFARCAIQRIMDGSVSSREDPVSIRLKRLDSLIEELEIRIRQLNEIVDENAKLHGTVKTRAKSV